MTWSTFYFYFRYLWNENDFETFQESMINLITVARKNGFAGSAGAVLGGFAEVSATGLNLTVAPGAAVLSSGELAAMEANTEVTLAGHASLIKNIVYVRLTTADGNNITRPTSPYDTVPLESIRTVTLGVVSGTAGGDWPALPNAATDVPVLGVVCNATDVLYYDRTKCQLMTKVGTLGLGRRHNVVVANQQWGDYMSLAAAASSLSVGDRVRVAEDQTGDVLITLNTRDVEVTFDRGKKLIKGLSATGIVMAASGIHLRGASLRSYSGGSDVGVIATSAASACVVADCVFMTCTLGYPVDESTGLTSYGIMEV